MILTSGLTLCGVLTYLLLAALHTFRGLQTLAVPLLALILVALHRLGTDPARPQFGRWLPVGIAAIVFLELFGLAGLIRARGLPDASSIRRSDAGVRFADCGRDLPVPTRRPGRGLVEISAGIRVEYEHEHELP